jgi:hypothetical protein
MKKRKCVKCGFETDLHRYKYVPEGIDLIHWNMHVYEHGKPPAEKKIIPEHIEITCGACGYKWVIECEDKLEEEIYERLIQR